MKLCWIYRWTSALNYMKSEAVALDHVLLNQCQLRVLMVLDAAIASCWNEIHELHIVARFW
jgi:hypothetical protein